MTNRIDILGNSDPSFYQDFNGLASIKANGNQKSGLELAAGQFEVEFLQSVLKHMRAASDALQEGDEDSIAHSDQQGFYRDLYDSQLAMSMVKKGGIGLKEQIVSQMSPHLLKNSVNEVAYPDNASQANQLETD